MRDYTQLVDQVVEYLGGKDNITYCTHCVTRLRVNVKDKGLVDKDKIDQVAGVIGSRWVGEQYQIIIGQSVGDAYDLLIQKTGLQRQEAIDENLDAPKRRLSVGAFFDAFAGVMTPIIPVLLGGGLLKVLIVLLEQLGILVPTGPTDVTLTFVGDAAFYFLPVFIGWSGAKKFGGNPGLGMLLGAILIHPAFVAMVTDQATGGSVFGIPIYAASYTSSVFPMFLTTLALGPVEKFIGKHSPDAIRSITEPLLTLLVMTPLMLCLLAPIGAWFGTIFAAAIMWLYNTLGFVGVAVLAAVFPYVVMTGMHTAFGPYIIQSLATFGYDPIICTANFISNFNQGAACLAVSIKSKVTSVKSTAATCCITAIFGGVTEPAMYGITLKLKTPMYGAMIGSAVGGVIAGLVRVFLYAFPGNGGLFGLVAFIGPTAANLMWLAIAIVVGMIVTFVATMIIYKDAPTDSSAAVDTASDQQ